MQRWHQGWLLGQRTSDLRKRSKNKQHRKKLMHRLLIQKDKQKVESRHLLRHRSKQILKHLQGSRSKRLSNKLKKKKPKKRGKRRKLKRLRRQDLLLSRMISTEMES